MRENDRLFAPSDFPAALALLSRWPLRVSVSAMARGARAAWSWPLVGLALAGVAAFLATLAQAIGLTPEISALLALGLLVVQTGALHEDGLADSADGVWGGHDRARRLEIMKDSAIGSYGVLALILALALRGAGLIALSGDLALGLLVSAALSRAAMAWVMQMLPNARASGLSHHTGRPGAAATGAALAIAAVIALALAGWAGFWACIAVLATALACAALARAKIGGQTGDVLGATQQLSEIACLLALTAAL